MRRHNAFSLILSALFIIGVPATMSMAASMGIFDSPHNFSESRSAGSLDFKSTSEERICIFCHTPHHSNSEGPLWSRDVSDQTNYKMYDSPTQLSKPELMPTNASRLCLGCHDGTIAIGTVQGGLNLGVLVTLKDNPNQLALINGADQNDLSGDHPISFIYKVKDGLIPPGSIAPPVKLTSSMLECTSCHNPHDNKYGNFLVVNTATDGSALCAYCHVTTGWAASSHKAINTGGGGTDVFPGCGVCHMQHKAPGHEYILKYGSEQNNCLTACHSDISTSFSKSYSHPVTLYNGMHAPNETVNPTADKHVKCADCHNPHQANAEIPSGSPPDISTKGPLAGVRGVSKESTETNPAKYQYEICYRCHASGGDNYVDSSQLPSRQWSSFNELLRFSTGNASFHPVAGKTNNGGGSYAVLSLKTPATGSIITCTGCHSSHGADYQHQLQYRYDADVLGSPTPANYDLCFQCHQEFTTYTTGFSNAGVDLHRSHVFPAGERAPVPCSTCHDPHGVLGAAHLINFDLLRLAPASTPVYTSNFSGGSCTVSCHSGAQPYVYSRAL